MKLPPKKKELLTAGKKKFPVPKRTVKKAEEGAKTAPASVRRIVKPKPEILEKVRKKSSVKKTSASKTVEVDVEQIRKALEPKGLKSIYEKTPPAPEEPKKVSGRSFNQPFSVFIKDDDYNSLFPNFYNDTRVVLLARDPHWLFAYWEVSHGSLDSMRGSLGDAFCSASTILRVYDVTNVLFDGKNANKYFDVRLSGGASSWYLHVGEPNRRWLVEIGLLLPNGSFHSFTRSNTIKTPADAVSSVIDGEWAISEELMKRAYPAEWEVSSAGVSGQAKKLRMLGASEKAAPGGASEWLSSWSSPKGESGKPPLFWLRVGTEIIIYGATEPDAAVTMNGKPVKLERDGTFGTRFNLTDGEHLVTIEARSADGIFYRAYTIDVSKHTREGNK